MNTAFESIKAGLLQAIAHQQKKSQDVIVHGPARPFAKTTDTDAPRK
ncbi:hypothetical protein [Salinisphaera aquimarina]|uniref:Uncharacterized protein n=1 Tax=Salinisphaera aquimarina TaxID=2094031 RepID=A0ABV7ERN4_9GAMM